MHKTIQHLLIACFSLAIITAFAQQPKFKGQAPIEIVPTAAKPISKQWKGEFPLDDGAVVFSNQFEGARLNGVIKTNDSTYTALITSENTPVNPSPWYAFQVWSKTQRTIYIMLTYQEGAKHRYYPKLSRDGETWSRLDAAKLTEYEKGTADFGMGSLPVKVMMEVAVGKEPLWIAGQELENAAHVSAWAAQLSEEKHVEVNELGKSREGRTMEVMTIGKSKRKKMLMVISRQHPPEVTGYLAMKIFVETLAGDSRLAKKFRRKYTTYVVPLMNPDGVDNGHWRHNAGGIDLNRDWAQFNHPETRHVRDFMAERVAETKGKFYFGIDFHSTWDDIYYTLDEKFKGNMPGLVPKWLEAIKKATPGYDPNIRPSHKIEPTAVSRNYFFKAHGAEALVYEIGDNTDREHIKEKGRISAEKLMELLLEND